MGKDTLKCIFDTDTDTFIKLYLRYRYKIYQQNCIFKIQIQDTFQKMYLKDTDTRYIILVV